MASGPFPAIDASPRPISPVKARRRAREPAAALALTSAMKMAWISR